LCEQWQRTEGGIAGKNRKAEPLRFENPREITESFITASRKLAQGEFTESDARAMLDSLLVAGQENPLSRETTREVFRNWLKGKALSKSSRTSDRYNTVVNLFLEHIAPKADRSLAALTVRDVEGYRDSRLNDKLSPRTVALDIKIIRGVLEGAKRQGLILRNPALGCELPQGKSSERDTFSVEEIRAVLKVGTDEWKTAVLFGYYLGARLEDAVASRRYRCRR
jgi:integrase